MCGDFLFVCLFYQKVKRKPKEDVKSGTEGRENRGEEAAA